MGRQQTELGSLHTSSDLLLVLFGMLPAVKHIGELNSRAIRLVFTYHYEIMLGAQPPRE